LGSVRIEIASKSGAEVPYLCPDMIDFFAFIWR
jgi:hypothetical protein